ncbi:serine/threonine-protein kinase/endoribonuclease IRE1a-like [Olea europaea var. sylvestris]|uniref:serine/threonine-protein kinase/endoribonuclease IRE1a-like n=1 Tax=Olea europaea var. sylvestris TaxID=158386 RepID=UPI000C1D7C23|nr:serine/threonine-protein kinase/endoribonuclease IRE1a-like [Olea europaea var. sylvestris]
MDTEFSMEYRVHLESIKGSMQEVELWKADGYPSPVLLKLMRDVICGLVHLHELGIVHRDLKPQNVLIFKDRSFCAKLSDMGISKRLIEDTSSLGHHATGCGSSGWQAPEQLLRQRQTRAVDVFSLGCVLFFCFTGGRHPFGSPLERDINITKNKVDLFLVEHIPEAIDLLLQLLNPNAEMRPKASELLYHPLFWSAEMRLSFLRDTSDRVELEDRETDPLLLKALESTAPLALGAKWDEKMESSFLDNIGRYRRYKYDSVRDLLRAMRNKLNHYRELPTEMQKLIGSVPEGFDRYFMTRFPKLLIEVYKVMYTHCREEEWFHKYFKGTTF